MVTLRYDRGTLLVEGLDPAEAVCVPEAREDARVGGALRAPAHHYHLVVRSLVARGVAYADEARAYATVDLPPPEHTPRPYQQAAVDAWRASSRRGLVVLPTGSGKTLVAALAIRDAGRAALVVVPTIDLLHQWHDVLEGHFGGPIGAVGGGEHRVEPLTVITYDSAYLHLEHLGARFGLVVFDEAHHLSAPTYQQAAALSLAPYRLGLTATPNEAHAGRIAELIGPLVFRREIGDLAGDVLSSYETVTLRVPLSPEERAAYEAARGTYRRFVEDKGIRLGGPFGWRRFLEATSRSREGRAAFLAWREQRRLSMGAEAKFAQLETILARHRGERVVVFTNDNETAYAVSQRFLVPVITHQTRGPERRAILSGLREGTLPVVATSRVLNEGVDVPEVSVGVVLSGTATVREHVQRLGRILRPGEGKHAILYEVVAASTAEEATSDRRRDHDAYR
ncbi:MAG: DEAD/DEAH box helicase family protein [Planctomycetes bacterium]|nr:DEAD/DEAH box helicase family protein [Planctomycetota bacterium]